MPVSTDEQDLTANEKRWPFGRGARADYVV
jgi:hypothetical protein